MDKSVVLILILFFTKAEAQNASALAMADSLSQTGNYSKAIVVYKSISEKNQAFKIAKNYEALGNTFEAINYYELGFENDKEGILPKYNYGKLLSSTGRLKEADSVFDALLKQDPKNPNFYYQRGLVAEKQNDSLALKYFFNATIHDSGHQNAIYKLGRYWTSKRNFMAAGRFIERGLKANPNSSRFISLNALVNYHSKSYHNAIKHYERLLELNQTNVQLHENLADSYLNTNQFEKAIEQLTILINVYNDKSPSYHSQIARGFSAIKENDKAIHHLELCIALQEVSLESQYMLLAFIYKRKGDYKKVFEMMQLAVKENSQSEMVQYQFTVAADNYFEDKNSVLKYYEKFLSKFGETGQFRELAKQRVKDIKEELHFSKD